jgi:membrane protein
MPWAAWKQVLVRTWNESDDDNIGIVAAGVAFYGFLALVPLLGVLVLSYGLVAEPETVLRNVQALTRVMPQEAAKLIGEQLMNVVTTSGTKKGLGVLLALAIALFGARNGAGSIITALNIAYEEKEKRSFVMVNFMGILITIGGVLAAIVAILAIAAISSLEKLLPEAYGIVAITGQIVSYVLLMLSGATGAAALYRFAPCRAGPRWQWLTPGSILVGVLWLGITWGFGIYIANFGDYNATYGSLGAVVVLLTWLYLSSYILLFGAELNAELEHQTAHDTTTGPPAPLGKRGAWVADHVAGEHDAPPDRARSPMQD